MFRPQRDQREGRVGAGDQKVDRHVVAHLQHLLGARMRDRMVDGRDGVKQDRRGAEDRAADHLPRHLLATLHAYREGRRHSRSDSEYVARNPGLLG